MNPKLRIITIPMLAALLYLGFYSLLDAHLISGLLGLFFATLIQQLIEPMEY